MYKKISKFVEFYRHNLRQILLVMCELLMLLHVHGKQFMSGQSFNLTKLFLGITLLHMNRPNKTESALSVSLMCSLSPEDLHSELIRPLKRLTSTNKLTYFRQLLTTALFESMEGGM